jgi:uncharacterized protein (DUF58 family)
MTPRYRPKLPRYVGLAGFLLLLGIFTGLSELVVMAVPIMMSLAVGLALSGAPGVRARLTCDTRRCLEDESISFRVELETRKGAAELTYGLPLPEPLEVEVGSARRAVFVDRDSSRTESLQAVANRWGAYDLGRLALRVHRPGRFVVYEEIRDAGVEVRVFPGAERILRGVVPPMTQVYSGNYVSRAAGEGIEFAVVRPFAYGDDLRHVNWRVTSRRQELHVNRFHIERNADVVMFLDTFTDVRTGDLSTLDLSVRGAASLAWRYLSRKDRVGLVGFGGVVTWLKVASGQMQVYRIVDHLLRTRPAESFAWKAIEFLPRGTLPPHALVVAFSPLVDRRSIRALHDLHERGFGLVVIDVLDEDAVPAEQSAEGRLAHRVWKLERHALRFELGGRGIPVVRWTEGSSLEAALSEIPRLRPPRLARAGVGP